MRFRQSFLGVLLIGLIGWISGLSIFSSSVWAAEEFLPPEQAFVFTSKAVNDTTIELH